jgi:hypothetical protein
MRRHALPFAVIAAVGGLLAGRAPGWAAPATFVSGTGTDTGTCPITAPCATFQFAHDQTDAKGVISVVSPGSFGPVTISKAISIVAKKGPALILTATAACGASAGGAICVNAGAADVVHLEGVTIDLDQAGKNGITFNTGAALHVQNFAIRNVGSNGIAFFPAAVSDLFVADTSIEDSGLGVTVAPPDVATANVILLRVHVGNSVFNGFTFAFNASGNGTGKIAATVRDCAVSGGSEAILATRAGPGTLAVDVMVDRTALLNSGTGVHAGGAGVAVRIGDSTVTGNTTGLHAQSGATIASDPTNKVIGNGDDSATQLSVGRRR